MVHGFGFSFLLGERLQFAGSHLVTSLLAFNLGVEAGQLLVLAIAVPALGVLFKSWLPEPTGGIILSALVAHTAWHWMTERGEQLSRFPWPTIDAVALSALLWWAMAGVALAAILWLVSGLVQRIHGSDEDRPSDPAAPPRAS